VGTIGKSLRELWTGTRGAQYSVGTIQTLCTWPWQETVCWAKEKLQRYLRIIGLITSLLPVTP